MLRLPGAQVDRDLVLERLVDFVEEMFEQDVFARDRRIGFEFEHPVAIRPLHRLEAGASLSDDGRDASLAELKRTVLAGCLGGPPGYRSLFESRHVFLRRSAHHYRERVIT
jgi:hypothetical protein